MNMFHGKNGGKKWKDKPFKPSYQFQDQKIMKLLKGVFYYDNAIFSS